MINIISGRYKRRQIYVAGRTRPPLQRTREWVFNALLNYIDLENCIVLDLFAGTGSFGLECISRGANIVYFVEENMSTVKQLLKTIELWDINNGKILRMNAAYLPKCVNQPDLIFLDPPFGHNMIQVMIERLIKKCWIKSNCIIVLRTEHPFEDGRFSTLNMEIMGISIIYILTKKD